MDDIDRLANERDLVRSFTEGHLGVLKLLTEHRPSADIRRAICSHVETSMTTPWPGNEASARNGVLAITLRLLPDDTLDAVALRAIPAPLADVVSTRVLDAVEAARTGPHPPRFEIPDPTDPDRTVWGYVVPGIGGHPLGALCVSRTWPTEEVGRTKVAFYSAAQLLQLSLEQHRAASNTAAMIAAERESFANQLHDDPIQTITVLSLTLQRLGRDSPPELAAQLDEVRQRADHAIERMRKLLFELHPSVLDEDGLAVAIEVYLEQTMEPLNIAWTLTDRLANEPDPATSVLAYRLIHESLANVARHSSAENLSVVLHDQDGGIAVEIIDDGVGFDLAAIPRRRPGHLGISNVHYLAERSGGRYDVITSLGEGCTVRIWVPLDHEPPVPPPI